MVIVHSYVKLPEGKLVYNSNFTMVYGTQITILTGAGLLTNL